MKVACPRCGQDRVYEEQLRPDGTTAHSLVKQCACLFWPEAPKPIDNTVQQMMDGLVRPQ